MNPELKTATYQIICRSRNKARCFILQEDYEDFLQVLKKLPEKFGIELYAYALLPKHFHLCLKTSQPNLRAAIKSLLEIYSLKYQRRHNLKTKTFESKFKSLIVQKDKYLRESLRYIHRRPLRFGLCREIKDYKWSSYKDYHQNRNCDWLSQREALTHFDPDPAKAAQKFCEYIESPKESLMQNILEAKRWPKILGTELYQQSLKSLWR